MSTIVTVSRRDFFKVAQAAGAGLVLGCHLPGSSAWAGQTAADSLQPNAFVQVRPDGKIAIWVAKSEMGQGVKTALPMIVAEELDADWASVEIRQADFDPKFGDQSTGSSLSVQSTYDPLRRAGATARVMLVAAAAQQWGVHASSCRTERGNVIHDASNRRLGYGALVKAAAAIPVPDVKQVPLKDPKTFRLVGTAVPRTDTPAKVDGSAVYGIDVKVPGMLYAVIARCPVFGGEVESFDDSKAKAVSGVRQIVALAPVAIPYPFSGKPVPGGEGNYNSLPAGVAVIADSTWAAIRGRQALAIKWKEGPAAAITTASLREELRKAVSSAGTQSRNDGDVDAALSSAAKTIEAEYALPFLAHAPLEPVNCTAHATANGCEVWAPTQIPEAAAAAVSLVLQVPVDAVKVHVTYIGGGFGRRLCQDYAPVAALVSRAAGAPVKVLWTREDDIQHDYYRPASFHRLRAGLDAQGQPAAWHHRLVSTSITSFFNGPKARGLAGDELRAQDFPCYAIPNYRLEYSSAETMIPRGWWRSVEQYVNTFVAQSFFDELAAAAGKDPLAMRLDAIGDKGKMPFGRGQVDLVRLKHVLQEAARRASWGTPPPRGQGRGIAAQFSFNSYVAHVAEVSATGSQVRVHRIVCVADCGQVINPDTVKAQIEGSIVWALAATLKHEITIKGGRVEQSNFSNYPMPRITDMPVVEVHLVPSTEAPGGVGETGVAPVAPAVTNAIFALTGKRIRSLPIKASDLV